jgi:hypothetical protein
MQRLCVECNWCHEEAVQDKFIHGGNDFIWTCKQPLTQLKVTHGVTIAPLCFVARNDDTSCGPQGRYWSFIGFEEDFPATYAQVRGE